MPTPTPLPFATPAINIPLDGINNDFAMHAVQFWNSFETITTAFQIALLLVVILGGIGFLISAVRNL